MADSHPSLDPASDNSSRSSSTATLDGAPAALEIKLADDPWSLTPAERLELRASLGAAQVEWLRRIEGLIEPPAIDESFPAFLLATRRFAHLACAIGEATSQSRLDTGTADELQRFVDRYREYLRP